MSQETTATNAKGGEGSLPSGQQKTKESEGLLPSDQQENGCGGQLQLPTPEEAVTEEGKCREDGPEEKLETLVPENDVLTHKIREIQNETLPDSETVSREHAMER